MSYLYFVGAGKSAISNVVRELGYECIERDLFLFDKSGFPIDNEDIVPCGADFLKDGEEVYEDSYDVIITNPPYHSKHEFLSKCLSLGKPFALLLPMQTFSTKKFADYGSEFKLHIRMLLPSPAFLHNGRSIKVGEVAWIFGNFPVINDMESDYDFNFFRL